MLQWVPSVIKKKKCKDVKEKKENECLLRAYFMAAVSFTHPQVLTEYDHVLQSKKALYAQIHRAPGVGAQPTATTLVTMPVSDVRAPGCNAWLQLLTPASR